MNVSWTRARSLMHAGARNEIARQVPEGYCRGTTRSSRGSTSRAGFRAAEGVGGDYLRLRRHARRQPRHARIADVSGHGESARRSTWRRRKAPSHSEARDSPLPGRTCCAVNEVLAIGLSHPADMFATFVFARFLPDGRSHRLVE
jgi:hypothetical protein